MRRGGRLLVLGSILTALGVTGSCSSVDGSKVANDAITADIDVSGGHHGSVTFAVGLKSGRHDVDLTGDAHVVGETSDLRTTLDKGKFFGQTSYRGTIYGDHGYGAGEELTVRLERGGETTDAVSTVHLPEDVTVSSPVAGASLSRAAGFTIAVDDAPGAIQVLFTGTCLDAAQPRLDLAEGEPVVVPAGFVKLASGQEPTTCPVSVTVSRVLTGELSPDFKGGQISASTSVSLDVTSAP